MDPSYKASETAGVVVTPTVAPTTTPPTTTIPQTFIEPTTPVVTTVPQKDLDAIRAQLAAPGWNHVVATHNRRDASHVDIYLAIEGNAARGLVLLATIGARNLAIHGALASQVEELEPRVEQALRREEKNAQLLATVEKLDSHSRSRVLQYLKAVTELVPQSSYLTTFRYREDKIEVEGISDKASELIAILESSPYFTGVEFTAPTTKYLSNQERFSLRMRLEQ